MIHSGFPRKLMSEQKFELGLPPSLYELLNNQMTFLFYNCGGHAMTWEI